MYRKSWIVILAAFLLLAAAASLTAAARDWSPGALYKLSPAETTFIHKEADLVKNDSMPAPLTSVNAAPAARGSSAGSLMAPALVDTDNPGPAFQTAAASRKETGGKTVYLTFDDGPSKLTAEVLDILNRYKVKATFFVLGQQAQRSPELIRQIVDGGHALGNHTYDHNYEKLYHNFSDFWGQIKQTEEILRGITGFRPQLVRAPGGTYGHFDKTYFELLDQAGYKVFDWDIDSGDSARKGVPAADILKQATDTGDLKQVVLLMHDGGGHDNTVKALPKIIEDYRAKGFSFATIDPDMEPVQFHVGGKLPKGRQTPSQTWIEEHITPNKAFFDQSQLPLGISAAGVQTVLDSGEYKLQDGTFLVPLRSTAERLGGTVEWDAGNRQAKVKWGKGMFVLYAEAGESRIKKGGLLSTEPSLQIRNNTIWISLRSLLEGLGHPVQKVNQTEKQWNVIAP